MAESKVALVTGAGSGIGRDTALLLAESGYSLALVARSQDKLESVAREIEGKGGPSCLVIPADLGDAEKARGVIDRIIESFDRLDALVNVAGHADLGPIEKLDAATVRRSLAINVEAIMHLTATAWPYFRKQKSGIVVNITSMAAFDPFPGFGLYAPAKAAATMFTQCTAAEGKKIGVKAVAIAPGAVETPMLRSMFDTRAIPEDKTLDPIEVAAVVRDCITGAKPFTSGESIQMRT
ncbi:MAG: SDR family oxidoreductase [Phycisphaeraceae bacterium]|nr:SDR family oxidoreductase [Phycisphaeraceae bacterium]